MLKSKSNLRNKPVLNASKSKLKRPFDSVTYVQDQPAKNDQTESKDTCSRYLKHHATAEE